MTPIELGVGALVLGKLSSSSTSDGVPSTDLRLVWGHVNGKPVQLMLSSIGTDRNGRPAELRNDAAAAFNAMRRAAAADGVTLEVDSSFRTMAEQAVFRAAYEAGAGPIAALPGYSNHEGGTAVDIDTDSGTNDAFHWLTANAGAYGFARTVPSEPWHWEFV